MENQLLISKFQVKNLTGHKNNRICIQCGNLSFHQKKIASYSKECEKILHIEENTN